MTIQTLSPCGLLGTRSDSGLTDEHSALLDFLPVLYPGGADWFARASEQVSCGTADAAEVRVAGEVAGVMLGVAKPSGRYKIRTLFVSPRFRGQGIGSALMGHAKRSAIQAGCSAVYVTAAKTIRSEFQPAVMAGGFTLIATSLNRYGPGRDEDVYELSFAKHSRH